MKNPAAGGGRWVDVAPARFAKWVDGFAGRHGGITGVTAVADTVTFAAADGAVAECHPPFGRREGDVARSATEGEGATVLAGTIAARALADRTVGVLLVRLGGYAAGVFTGSPPRLVASKAGRRLVHGRSAAGGWSQHRFARRRDKQAGEALNAAADAAVRIFGEVTQLDAVVLGGDRRAVDGLRDDPRLRPYLDRAEERFLTVPDPKLSVLSEAPKAYTAIRVRVVEPNR